MRPEHWWYTIPLRLRSLFRRRRVERELHEELQEHLASLREEFIAQGLSPAEARRAALRQMGGIEQVKEECRDRWGVRFFEALLQDVRYGARTLRKHRGFTFITVLTLALGIGANTAIFSSVNGILLHPLAYPDSDRLVTITGDLPDFQDVQLSYLEWQRIRSESRALKLVAAKQYALYWTDDGTPEILRGARVSADYFPVLGIAPLRGRVIRPSDIETGNESVVVISYGYWQQHFGGDPGIVNKVITLYKKKYTVIGVMPAQFGIAQARNRPAEKVWIPLVPSAAEKTSYGWRSKEIYARLRTGATLAQANAELQTIGERFARELPKATAPLRLHAELYRDSIVKRTRTVLLVLLSAVGFVLLIACVNVSNLALYRGWGRRREIAIRQALGASRTRVIRQMLVESLMLAALGGGCGLLLAGWGIAALRAMAPSDTPRLDQVHLDPMVLGYAAAISILAGIIFGLAPALQISSQNTDSGLKQKDAAAGMDHDQRQPWRLRSVLVVTEVALALVLAAASLLAVRSFAKLITVPLGLRTDNVLSMWTTVSQGTCPPEPPCPAFDEMLQGVSAIPGVQSAALSSMTPLGQSYATYQMMIQGRPVPEGKEPSAELMETSDGYFSVLDIPVVQGRAFTPADRSANSGVAVVNQMLADKYFGGEPLGKRISVEKDKDKHPIWLEIVGVAGNTRDIEPGKPPRPEVYILFGRVHKYRSVNVLVRSAGDPAALVGAVKGEIWAVDKGAPISDVESLRDVHAEAVSEPRFRTVLLALFSGLGVLLAAVGISGVISYSVTQRTHELGVRMALGAEPAAIARLVLRQGLMLAGIGIPIGVAGAVGLTRFLRSLLFEVSPLDPVTFVGVTLLFVMIAALASLLPARRAMQVDPMVALRYE